MSNSFHLAIPAGDLEKAEAFYTKILGCKTGNREKDKWVDVDFWGNELTLHQTSMKLPRERHDVDMGDVPESATMIGIPAKAVKLENKGKFRPYGVDDKVKDE